MSTSLFPTTHGTFLAEIREEISRLSPDERAATPHAADAREKAREEARRALRTHLLERYHRPLAVLLRAHAPALADEAEDIVHGFLAEALGRTSDAPERFVARFEASGMRLRRWMANGLLFHARGVLRDRQRERLRFAARELDELDARLAPAADEAFERAWAQSIVREACARVEEALRESSRGRTDIAWRVFWRHAIEGRAYAELAGEFGLSPQALADLVRGVSRRVRAEIERTLLDEGVPGPEIAAEVARLAARLTEPGE